MQGKIRADCLYKEGSIANLNSPGMSHAKNTFSCSRILNEAYLITLIDLVLELFTFGKLKKIGTKQSTIEGILLISLISSAPSPRL